MLVVRSKNEKEISVILEAMEGCTVEKHWENKPIPQKAPVIMEGTCSSCPHFDSRRGEGRAAFVKWGTCQKHNANVNEHRKQCSTYKQEVESREEVKSGETNKERETRRIYVA